VHLDLDQPIALAGLAAATLHVEAEPSRSVATNLGVWDLGEQLSDGSEQTGVGRRIRARRASDRTLVDVDHLVDVLDAGDPVVRSGNHPRAIEVPRQRSVQDILDQRGLARSGDSGHGDEQSERDLDVEIPQVVLAGSLDPQHPPPLCWAPASRKGDRHIAVEVLARER
jgi:hypothetical protein